MLGFHACVWLFAVKTVKDTQCGFKVKTFLCFSTKNYLLFIFFLSQLLKRKTALKLFKTLHIERWAFDVEMLKVFVLKSVIVPTDINI